MRARTRDAIVVGVFTVGAVLMRLAWDPLGPWVTLGVAVLAALTAAAVYRMPLPASRPSPDRPPLALRSTDAQ